MSNQDIYIQTNNALAEGNYDELSRTAPKLSKGKTSAKAPSMEKRNFLDT